MQDRDHYFVALRLAEGEALRRILHCKLPHGPPLSPGNTSIGLRSQRPFEIALWELNFNRLSS